MVDWNFDTAPDWTYDEPSGQYFTGDPSQEENWLPWGDWPNRNFPFYEPSQDYPAPTPYYRDEIPPAGMTAAAPAAPTLPTGRQQRVITMNPGPGLTMWNFERAKLERELVQDKLKLEFGIKQMEFLHQKKMAEINQGNMLAARETEIERQGLEYFIQLSAARAQLARAELANFVENAQQQQRIAGSSILANPGAMSRHLALLGARR